MNNITVWFSDINHILSCGVISRSELSLKLQIWMSTWLIYIITCKSHRISDVIMSRIELSFLLKLPKVSVFWGCKVLSPKLGLTLCWVQSLALQWTWPDPSLRGTPGVRGRPTPRLENAAELASSFPKDAPVHIPLPFRALRAPGCWMQLSLLGRVPRPCQGCSPTSAPSSPSCRPRPPKSATSAWYCHHRPC